MGIGQRRARHLRASTTCTAVWRYCQRFADGGATEVDEAETKLGASPDDYGTVQRDCLAGGNLLLCVVWGDS